MNRVDQLKSLLEGRGVMFRVAAEMLGGPSEVERLVELARKRDLPRIGYRTLCDGSEWIFRGGRQADDESRRARIRMELEPFVLDREMISRTELMDMFRGMPISPIDEVLISEGYYCDPVADAREGLEGEWYRFVGFEMPVDLRWMCMKQIRPLWLSGMSEELAWEIVSELPTMEGITRTWFNNCWAVVRNGQQGTLG